MTRFLTIVVVAAALLSLYAVSFADAPHRRALLVGVNGYTHHTDHDAEELHTSRDVAAIKSVLMAKWGFEEADIKVLETSDDTKRQSIMNWFRKFLVDPAKPGDIIYFHFSGHGRTVADLKRDTHVDQTLMTSDYNVNDASNDIRGRDITPLLVELEKPEHLPASITLTFDSCFSGTITRGPARGRGYNRGGPTSAPHWDPHTLAGGEFDPGFAARKGYIVISACRADQTDEEVNVGSGKSMGSLSYALSTALGEANNEATYRQVMERVGSIMKAFGLDQEPQIEGDWDKTLFSGKLIQPRYTLTVSLDSSSRRPVLMAGFPMGVTVGSKYSLYKNGSDIRTAQPIATAVVTSVDATHADLDYSLRYNIANSDLRGAVAILTERNYTPAVIKVDLSAVAHHPLYKDIQSALDDVGATADMKAAATGYEKSYDLRVLPAAAAALQGSDTAQVIGNNVPVGSLVVQRADGALLHITVKDATVVALPNNSDLPSLVASAVKQYVCWRTVNDLHNADGNDIPTIEVKYVPCRVDDAAKRISGDLPPAYSTGHQLEFKVGSQFYVMVKNTGNKDVYVTILDVQHDGIVNAMWPLLLVKTSNAVPADGQWHTTLLHDDDHTPLYWDVGQPTGPESVKAIVTLQPYDFSFLANTTRGIGANHKDPLERLLERAATGRGQQYGLPLNGWNVFGFNYTIVP